MTCRSWAAIASSAARAASTGEKAPDRKPSTSSAAPVVENYGPLGRFHHRIKTHGTWTLRQPFDGLYLWRDPHGQVYLVDHTGTHKITASGTTSGAATTYDPDIDVVPTDTVVEVDFTA